MYVTHCPDAVSYTHLDVYKRQVIYSIGFMPVLYKLKEDWYNLYPLLHRVEKPLQLNPPSILNGVLHQHKASALLVYTLHGRHTCRQGETLPPWLRRISAANATDLSEVVLEI